MGEEVDAAVFGRASQVQEASEVCLDDKDARGGRQCLRGHGVEGRAVRKDEGADGAHVLDELAAFQEEAETCAGRGSRRLRHVAEFWREEKRKQVHAGKGRGRPGTHTAACTRLGEQGDYHYRHQRHHHSQQAEASHCVQHARSQRLQLPEEVLDIGGFHVDYHLLGWANKLAEG